jgi:hypothetical protein
VDSSPSATSTDVGVSFIDTPFDLKMDEAAAVPRRPLVGLPSGIATAVTGEREHRRRPREHRAKPTSLDRPQPRARDGRTCVPLGICANSSGCWAAHWLIAFVGVTEGREGWRGEVAAWPHRCPADGCHDARRSKVGFGYTPT